MNRAFSVLMMLGVVGLGAAPALADKAAPAPAPNTPVKGRDIQSGLPTGQRMAPAKPKKNAQTSGAGATQLEAATEAKPVQPAGK